MNILKKSDTIDDLIKETQSRLKEKDDELKFLPEDAHLQAAGIHRERADLHGLMSMILRILGR